MNLYKLLIILLTTLFLLSCEMADSSSYEDSSSGMGITVNGLVKDYVTQEVLENVDINIRRSRIEPRLTQDDGFYKFTLEAEHKYILDFSKNEYVPLQYNVKTTKESLQELDTVYLVHVYMGETGGASGIVTSTSTSEVLQGVTLSLREGLNNQDGEIISTAISQSDGSYTFSNIKANTYTVQLSLEEYVTGYDTLYVIGEQSGSEQDFEISPAIFSVDGNTSVSGTVKDLITNLGLNGVSVSLRQGSDTMSGAVLGSTLTEGNATADGGFFFRNIVDGNYTLEMALDGYITGYGNIQVKTINDGNSTYYIEPEPSTEDNNTASGTISDFDSGLGLTGVKISLREGLDRHSGAVISITYSQDDGLYDFTRLAAGDYSIEMSLNGYTTDFGNLTVIEGEDSNDNDFSLVSTQLVGDNSMSGEISDASDGALLGGVLMSLREGSNVKTGTIVATTSSENNGSYLFEDLPAGDYTTEMELTGYERSFGNIEAIDGEDGTNQNFILSRELQAGEMRIIVTWDDGDPRDLDSYLHIVDGAFVRVLNFTSTKNDDDQPHIPDYAILEKDVYSGIKSPETIIIEDFSKGNYRYYIRKYSTVGDLNVSGASVTIFKSGETLDIDMNTTGNGIYWNVFDIIDGDINITNIIQSDTPDFNGL